MPSPATHQAPALEDCLILGIETSCDETAAAIVRGDGTIIAHKLLSQIKDHQDYGGVVPEIAARQHISHLDGLLRELMDSAGLSFSALTAIAATTGPGLIGGLMVGVMTAKALAASLNKPFIAVNHLEGHALTVRLTDDVPFPYLLLLASGGHCQILDVQGPGAYRRLGTTRDDAAGEAFDKTAKLLGLPYPGGPSVEREAANGDAARFKLPQPLKGSDGCDFSFSGLKTAVRREAEKIVEEKGILPVSDRADLCASFQDTMAACLADRTGKAADMFLAHHGASAAPYHLVVAGGVAANQTLRRRLAEVASEKGMTLTAPPLALCTDNGVMIAWAAMEHYRINPDINQMDMSARPRWPLDPVSEGGTGGGRKGRKS